MAAIDASTAAPRSGSMRLAERTLTVPAMGGSLEVRVAHRLGAADAAGRPDVAHDLRRLGRRVNRWAARLTRFSDTSELSALNADPARSNATVGPTLAAALDWAERAMDLAPGLVDVTLLDERLAAEGELAESGEPFLATGPRARWYLERRPRGGVVVRREAFRFDLDGVGKGWIADRALALLHDYPAAMVDADGDIALRMGAGVAWDVAIADPRPGAEDDLAVLHLDERLPRGLVGVATSGTSVHRWAPGVDGSQRHHLLDPRTRRPADTDVIQATVLAATAREAEVLAKAAVIAGSADGMDLLDRPGVHGAVLLLTSGETIALPQTLEWLA